MYTTGVLNPGTNMVAWDEPTATYDANGGSFPRIAICSEQGPLALGQPGGPSVIEVHNGNGILWYRPGRIVAPHYIQWSNSQWLDTGNPIQGAPSVACTGATGVETHALNSGTLASTTFTVY